MFIWYVYFIEYDLYGITFAFFSLVLYSYIHKLKENIALRAQMIGFFINIIETHSNLSNVLILQQSQCKSFAHFCKECRSCVSCLNIYIIRLLCLVYIEILELFVLFCARFHRNEVFSGKQV